MKPKEGPVGPELAPPIFVLGLTRRSGTSFLWELLTRHPGASRRDPIREDFLLHHADRLVSYVNAVVAEWSDGARDAEANHLLQHLTGGLLAFLQTGCDGSRVVTKTPSVRNLPWIFTLFPSATLVVLARDGRSVVESAVRSFGVSYEVATRAWLSGARTLLRFMEASPNGRYRVVRYEKLLTDFDEELSEVLEFCGLDPRAYDFEAARDTPLRGSSTDRGGSTELHWRPVRRPGGFQGLRRWEGWSAEHTGSSTRWRARSSSRSDTRSSQCREPGTVSRSAGSGPAYGSLTIRPSQSVTVLVPNTVGRQLSSERPVEPQ